ncbi:MAG: DNA primase, partial [Brooklawnia sp.]
HPAYRAIFETIQVTPYSGERWTEQLQEHTSDEMVRQLEIALLVEPILREPDEAYATAYTAKLKLLGTVRQLNELRSRLQRINPVDDSAAHKQAFTELISLEARRRQLEAVSLGAD